VTPRAPPSAWALLSVGRLEELTLSSHADLHVGACVPFYFWPRSVMLYLIHKANHADLSYRGGQGPIVHLVLDLRETVAWAEGEGLRWALTLSNAGSRYFEDRADLSQLDEIDWDAVRARDWQGRQEKKQAEFLVEHRVPWALVEGIGVHSRVVQDQATRAMTGGSHRPVVKIKPDWYY